MGLTKGELNCKIAAVTDEQGKAVVLNLSAGNCGEIQAVSRGGCGLNCLYVD